MLNILRTIGRRQCMRGWLILRQSSPLKRYRPKPDSGLLQRTKTRCVIIILNFTQWIHDPQFLPLLTCLLHVYKDETCNNHGLSKWEFYTVIRSCSHYTGCRNNGSRWCQRKMSYNPMGRKCVCSTVKKKKKRNRVDCQRSGEKKKDPKHTRD